MAPVIAPVQTRKRSTAQGRAIQYDKFGRPFRSEIAQGPGFDLTPAAGPVAPAPFSPTVENPATDEQIARAFYGPSQPGAPPPPMTQAQYQARKAAGFQSEGAVPPIGGMANTTLAGFPRPVQAPQAMSKQEIDAALRLMETTGNMNPAGRPGVRIDGQVYQPLGRPNYGEANRYQGRLSDEQAGIGSMTGGLGATGSMGSSLMRGRWPESPVHPERAALDAALAREEQRKAAAGAQGTAMVGGNVVDRDQFQQAWKDRQAMIARGEQGPHAPRLMTGIADRARAALASREATEKFAGNIAGDAQAAMNAVPVASVMAQYQAMGPGVAGPNSMGAMLNRAAAAPVQMPAEQVLGSSPLIPIGPGMYVPNPGAVAGATPRQVNIGRVGLGTPSAYLSKPKLPKNPIAGTVSAPPELAHSPMVTPGIGAPPIPTATGPYATGVANQLGLPAPSGGTPTYYTPPSPYPNFTTPGQPGYGMIPVQPVPSGGPPIPTATGPYASGQPSRPLGLPAPGVKDEGAAGVVSMNPKLENGRAPYTPPGPVTPTAPVGMSTRAKIGTGLAVGGAGVVGYGIMNGQPAVPVLPVGPDQEQVYYDRTYGETTDPIVAQNRMGRASEMARRKAAVQNRGMAKGEARDQRLGIASPEVVARNKLANSPETLAAMYAAEQNAVAKSAEPALLSQLGKYNTDMATATAQLQSATTPEQQLAAQQKIAEIESRQITAPTGQSSQAFLQNTLGRSNAAPVGPVGSTYVRPRQGVVAPVTTPKTIEQSKAEQAATAEPHREFVRGELSMGSSEESVLYALAARGVPLAVAKQLIKDERSAVSKGVAALGGEATGNAIKGMWDRNPTMTIPVGGTMF